MSTVVLQSIEWSKCFSFGENNKISLSGEPLTQNIAPNGYGKSSIPLVMEESLYNKNSKGIKKGDIPNRQLDGSYDIKHVFTVDNDTYEVITELRSSLLRMVRILVATLLQILLSKSKILLVLTLRPSSNWYINRQILVCNF